MFPRLLEIPLGGDSSITIYSYGFMVAVAILTASWLIGRELNRLQAEGRFGKIKSSKKGRAAKSSKDSNTGKDEKRKAKRTSFCLAATM